MLIALSFALAGLVNTLISDYFRTGDRVAAAVIFRASGAFYFLAGLLFSASAGAQLEIAKLSAWPGLIIASLGTYLAVWAYYTLKRHTFLIPTELVTDGPYSKVRHPIYAGLFLFSLGTSLIFGSVLAFGYAAVLLILFYVLGAAEERELAALFGARYVSYAKHTPAVFPKI